MSPVPAEYRLEKIAMTTNCYSEATYFDSSDESELPALALNVDRCPQWRSNRISDDL